MKRISLAILAVISAVACSPRLSEPVTQEEMYKVYETVKTPFKLGMIVKPEDSTKLVDCPSVFRFDGKWYMTYIIFDQKGYETWLAQSDDLVHWDTLGKILSYRDGAWDQVQRAGYVSLQDIRWGGSYKLNKYDGYYWMSYLGGAKTGYETKPLKIGMAKSKNLGVAKEWETFDEPVLSPTDDACQWFEKFTQYKSNIIRDKKKLTGHEFVMYYNAQGQNPETGVTAERIGMAFSDDMLHWTRYDGNPIEAHDVQNTITGDPQIQKIGDLYIMFYFRAFEPSKPYQAYNTFACSRNLVDWYDWVGPDLVYPTEDYDSTFAHKSWVVNWKGITYHFYCAVGSEGRGIALATSKPIQ